MMISLAKLAAIACELDAALDALDPLHPAFASLTQARGLYNIHVLHHLPAVQLIVSMRDYQATTYAAEQRAPEPEPAYATDAAGTYQGH